MGLGLDCGEYRFCWCSLRFYVVGGSWYFFFDFIPVYYFTVCETFSVSTNSQTMSFRSRFRFASTIHFSSLYLIIRFFFSQGYQNAGGLEFFLSGDVRYQGWAFLPFTFLGGIIILRSTRITEGCRLLSKFPMYFYNPPVSCCSFFFRFFSIEFSNGKGNKGMGDKLYLDRSEIGCSEHRWMDWAMSL